MNVDLYATLAAFSTVDLRSNDEILGEVLMAVSTGSAIVTGGYRHYGSETRSRL